jgi:adenylate cyclase
MSHGGTIVAYLGDGVMAVFGAPVAQDDHAARALATGRDLVETRLGRLNEWLETRGLEQRFALGAGIHSGPVMSGTIGSARRIEYAAVGDTTNVAARLQAHTKEAGVPLLLSEATRARLDGEDGLRPLGNVSLRGRAEQLAIWTLG